MNDDRYIEYTTDEFVLDEGFIQWVLHPDKDKDKSWAEFLGSYPEKRIQVQEAAFIIKAMQPVEDDVPHEKLDGILKRIYADSRVRKKKVIYNTLRIAAVLVIFIGVAGILFLNDHLHHRFPMASADIRDHNQGMVILSDGSSVKFDTKETVINQTAAGNLLINNDTIKVAAHAKKSDPAALNQIIIPYGKRSEVALADGTHVWLNSGSQLEYPAKFTGNTRQVYLSGEAFFDVKPDPGRPFYVITKEVKISVLGTRFNVSAYNEDQTMQTVLLQGKVNIRKNSLLSRAEELIPGERMVFNRESKIFSKDKVDTQYVTSWVYGYLIFENEPTPAIFKKLERYYNQTILSEKGLDEITFSGKLDLKDNLKDVLENIAFASSVKVTMEGGQYMIKK